MCCGDVVKLALLLLSVNSIANIFYADTKKPALCGPGGAGQSVFFGRGPEQLYGAVVSVGKGNVVVLADLAQNALPIAF